MKLKTTFIILLTSCFAFAQDGTTPTPNAIFPDAFVYQGGNTANTEFSTSGPNPAGLDTAVNTFYGDYSSFTSSNDQKHPSVSLGDIDNDGDLDFISGSETGIICYFENTGTATAPNWVSNSLTTLTDFRVNITQTSNQIRPEFVDIDDDGDLDVMVGTRWQYYQNDYGYGHKLDDLFLLENTGTVSAPNFVHVDSSTLGIDFQQLAEFTSPALVDLDNDDDLDIVTIGSDSIAYVENIGSKTIPDFQRRYGASNPFDTYADSSTLISNPEFLDFDNDNDLDLFYMNEAGFVKYAENKGTVTSPSFSDTDVIDIPTTGLSGVDLGTFGNIAFADVNGDNVLDILTTNWNPGVFGWFKGTSTTLSNTTIQTEAFDIYEKNRRFYCNNTEVDINVYLISGKQVPNNNLTCGIYFIIANDKDGNKKAVKKIINN